jgi:hypothetical protein
MLVRRRATPPPSPGFAGPGHSAVEVLRAADFAEQDPFILLMDDRIDMGEGQRVGGAHPHAGLETVTLLLEGAVDDRDEGQLTAGDAVWMTAGSGVVHNEHVTTRGKARILQLWLTLPPDRRWMQPSFQVLRLASLPILQKPGVEARLYSGSLGELRSPTRNQVPALLVDVKLEATTLELPVPHGYNGFVYVIEGEIDGAGAGETAWLDGPLQLRAAKSARVVVYAGQPQRRPIVSYGPFIGDTPADIERLYREHRSFPRLSQLPNS